jgi:hypothetical protein
MWDAATKHRTNGGLVRVMAPVTPLANADAEALAFAKAILPYLQGLMP